MTTWYHSCFHNSSGPGEDSKPDSRQRGHGSFQALLDLHGGQGSQNGFDNSGKRGEIHFQDGDNAKGAVYVLGQMSLLLKSWIEEGSIKEETIYGLELLNEPAAAWTPDLWDVIRDYFNYAGHDQIRQIFPAEMYNNLSVMPITKSYIKAV